MNIQTHYECIYFWLSVEYWVISLLRSLIDKCIPKKEGKLLLFLTLIGYRYQYYPRASVTECISYKQLSQYSRLIWTASSEFGTYSLCEQRRFRRACASAQSRQNLRCSLIQAVSQEEPSDRKPDPWLLWMAGHAQLKSVMTDCSKTQIRLTGLICQNTRHLFLWRRIWQYSV